MDRRTLLKAAAVVPAAAALPVLTAGAADAAPRRGRTLATGLNFPWGMDFLPDGSALVNERNSGRMVRVSPAGGYTVVGDVPSAHIGNEDGLLGLVVSPNYATDHRVYVQYSTPTDNRVAWLRYDGTTLGEPHVIVDGIPRGNIHNGGGLCFTRDQGLFITCGEAGTPALAQDKNSLGGKILRVKANGDPWPGNPYIGRNGDDRIFSIGHRNPQGIAQANTKRMWAAELGQNTWDELNQVSAGRNYGWPHSEGRDGAGVGFSDPLMQWHPVDASPSGLAIRHGYAWIGALRGQSLWRVDISGKGLRNSARLFHTTFGRVRNVKVAPDDNLWITTSNGGSTDRVIELVFP